MFKSFFSMLIYMHKDVFTYVYLTNLLSNYSWRRAGMFKSKWRYCRRSKHKLWRRRSTCRVSIARPFWHVANWNLSVGSFSVIIKLWRLVYLHKLQCCWWWKSYRSLLKIRTVAFFLVTLPITCMCRRWVACSASVADFKVGNTGIVNLLIPLYPLKPIHITCSIWSCHICFWEQCL